MTDLNDNAFNEDEGINTPSEEETLNSEPEIIKEPNPWDDAPTGVWFYDIQYEDGRLGNMTQSAERAYKRGWDLSNNIPVEDVQVSDINHGYYPKELCPHKTQEMIDRENAIQEISQLKKALSDTDYKAIKYAEGEINPEEYLPIKNQRAEWRAKINKLQEDFNI